MLVDAALNRGIAIYGMRQGEGIRYETLFRDETVGALDAVNGQEYVRMLRRAMDLGGFHQVIFICHAPLVWELADMPSYSRSVHRNYAAGYPWVLACIRLLASLLKLVMHAMVIVILLIWPATGTDPSVKNAIGGDSRRRNGDIGVVATTPLARRSGHFQSP